MVECSTLVCTCQVVTTDYNCTDVNNLLSTHAHATYHEAGEYEWDTHTRTHTQRQQNHEIKCIFARHISGNPNNIGIHHHRKLQTITQQPFMYWKRQIMPEVLPSDTGDAHVQFSVCFGLVAACVQAHECGSRLLQGWQPSRYETLHSRQVWHLAVQTARVPMHIYADVPDHSVLHVWSAVRQ